MTPTLPTGLTEHGVDERAWNGRREHAQSDVIADPRTASQMRRCPGHGRVLRRCLDRGVQPPNTLKSTVLALARIILPVLEAWRGLRRQAAELSRQLIVSARQSQACQILMSIPGVGAVTATSFATAIEDPGNFRKSRSVGAWLGLTTRR